MVVLVTAVLVVIVKKSLQQLILVIATQVSRALIVIKVLKHLLILISKKNLKHQSPFFFKKKDINECTTGANDCSTNAICSNTFGGFTCACKSGFSGDGVSCSG